jgi:hypothetical protein
MLSSRSSRQNNSVQEVACICKVSSHEDVGGVPEESKGLNLLSRGALSWLAAASVILSNVPAADAYNVRVEDVENPAMQAG